MEHTALELIDKLIGCWSPSTWESNEEYYLTVLAPSIVRSDGSAHLTATEQEIVTSLRQLLAEEEWRQLPTLIAQRRAQRLTQLGSDRARATARENARRRAAEEHTRRKEQAERKQRAIRREHERHDWERLRAEEARIARKKALITRLEAVFESDFLAADQVFAAHPDAHLVRSHEYDELKTTFVEAWAARMLLQPQLDAEQAAAIAATGGDVQVVARAGSGKTRTLVTRAIFLQKHCKVPPRELLLLAFNRKAAEEMKSRLAQTLGAPLPHVMTFHALAHALVHPEENIIFDDASGDQLGLSREVQESIDELVRSEEYGSRIRDLMLTHFREDWEQIVAGRFHLAMDELLAHRRALPRETLKGEYVKSFGEKVIANALFEHGVEYRYERNYRSNGVNYRPDFTIPLGPTGGVIIEYFGLRGEADYDELSQQKRRFWAERDETFLEFSPEDLAKNGVDGFVQLVLRDLRKAGISSQRRSEEEIWELVRRRAIDRFTSAMKTFVGRCRNLNLKPDGLEEMVARHTASSVSEALFLDVGVSVYRDYLERLKAGEKEDFNGLLWRAVSRVQNGQTRFVRDKGREHGDVAVLKFVLVDEFQDFSQKFFELINAMRTVNQNVKFFCVGDDWQAINGFAGSDLRFFEEFSSYFRGTVKRQIRTNYRSPRLVVEVGNALMDGRGMGAVPARQSVAGSVLLCKLDDFRPSAVEQARHPGDEVTPAVLRLARRFLDRGLDVVMLSRRNGVPWYVNYGEHRNASPDALPRFLEHVRSFLPKEERGRLTVSTTHRYKGLEQSAVIVLDAVEQSYPLIHPTWAFLRVFGDSIGQIQAEERRLFYVAVTRATDSLALLTEKAVESPFLRSICRHVRLAPVAWNELPPAPSLDGARCEIRVSDAFSVRDKLKDLGYRWDHAGKYWHRSVMADGFSIDVLLDQPWAKGGVRIEVVSETGQLLHRR